MRVATNASTRHSSLAGTDTCIQIGRNSTMRQVSTVKTSVTRPIAVVLLTLSLLLSSGVAITQAAPGGTRAGITSIVRKCTPISPRASMPTFCPR